MYHNLRMIIESTPPPLQPVVQIEKISVQKMSDFLDPTARMAQLGLRAEVTATVSGRTIVQVPNVPEFTISELTTIQNEKYSTQPTVIGVDLLHPSDEDRMALEKIGELIQRGAVFPIVIGEKLSYEHCTAAYVSSPDGIKLMTASHCFQKLYATGNNGKEVTSFQVDYGGTRSGISSKNLLPSGFFLLSKLIVPGTETTGGVDIIPLADLVVLQPPDCLEPDDAALVPRLVTYTLDDLEKIRAANETVYIVGYPISSQDRDFSLTPTVVATSVEKVSLAQGVGFWLTMNPSNPVTLRQMQGISGGYVLRRNPSTGNMEYLGVFSMTTYDGQGEVAEAFSFVPFIDFGTYSIDKSAWFQMLENDCEAVAGGPDSQKS